MARARTFTKLPLDRWAEIFGINPLHFNQCTIPNQEFENSTGCSASWFQYDWQDSERVSREQLADAIAQAESNIESFLNFHLLPDWDVDERQRTIRPYRPEFFNRGGTDVRGLRSAVKSDWGYVISGGIEVKTNVGNLAITWDDHDGDGVLERGRVAAVIDTAIKASEIELYYPNKGGDDAWRIRPIQVILDTAGNLEVCFRKELCVLEALQDNMLDPRGVDYTDDTQFLTTVDVFRHYNDPSVQATLQWEQGPGCGCSESTCATCAYVVQSACLTPRDNRLGWVAFTPGSWDPDNLGFTEECFALDRQPDTVRLYYRSGWQDKKLLYPTVEMDRDLAFAVAIYAASMLDRKVCDCKGLNDGIARWQSDLAIDTKEVRRIGPGGTLKALDCPFGTKAGAVEAWLRLQAPSRPIAITPAVFV